MFLMTSLKFRNKGEDISQKPSVTLTEDEIEKGLVLFKNYNLDDPDICCGLSLFRMCIPEIFRSLFMENVEYILPAMYFPYPELISFCDKKFGCIHDNWNKNIDDIDTLSSLCGIEKEELKQVLWDHTKKGLIRFETNLNLI